MYTNETLITAAEGMTMMGAAALAFNGSETMDSPLGNTIYRSDALDQFADYHGDMLQELWSADNDTF